MPWPVDNLLFSKRRTIHSLHICCSLLCVTLQTNMPKLFQLIVLLILCRSPKELQQKPFSGMQGLTFPHPSSPAQSRYAHATVRISPCRGQKLNNNFALGSLGTLKLFQIVFNKTYNRTFVLIQLLSAFLFFD